MLKAVTDSPPDEREVRCHCGRLLARATPEGLELKCTRCKSTVFLRVDEIANFEALVGARVAARKRL